MSIQNAKQKRLNLKYLLKGLDGCELQNATDRIQKWLNNRIGRQYYTWIYDYNFPDDGIIFMNRADAVLFKVGFKL